LYNLARGVSAGGIIVEIGGLYGGTTAALGLANPSARIVVVDDFSWSPLDGGHDYESVRSDLATLGPHARKIALHDWDNPAWPGIRLAVEEFVKASLGWRVSHSVEMVVVLERGS
jgi:hypothetical protein